MIRVEALTAEGMESWEGTTLAIEDDEVWLDDMLILRAKHADTVEFPPVNTIGWISDDSGAFVNCWGVR